MHLQFRGLKLFGHHGLRPEEQERGQFFLIDVRLEIERASGRDDLAETVDYTAVMEAIRELNQRERFKLLESFAQAIAGLLVERFPQVRRARARVRKRLLWSGVDVEWVAAEAVQARS